MFFAIYPALEKNSIGYAIFAGALFGLMSYATYTVVNYATLRGWPLEVVFVDLAWGTFINGATAGIAYYVINLFAK